MNGTFFVCAFVAKHCVYTGPMPLVDAVIVAGAMVACGTPASVTPLALWPGTIDGRLNDVAGGILKRLAKESAAENPKPMPRVTAYTALTRGTCLN